MPASAFSFNGKNEAAQRAAARQAARMVKRVSQETRAGIRAIVVRSIRDGVPPYDAARAIYSLVGLTDAQAHAVANYREAMINLGHSPERVLQLMDRYAEKLRRYRSEVIARTEIMGALNAGAAESWVQATKAGLLGKGALKEWIATPGERTCPDCGPMDGKRVPLTSKFDTGIGLVDGPPLHPQCRCAVVPVA